MHRLSQMNQITTKHIRSLVANFASAVAVLFLVTTSQAQPPRVAQADLDFAASGFVLPAGVSSFHPKNIQQAVMRTPVNAAGPSTVAQVGFLGSGCDAGACDAPGMGAVPMGYGNPGCGSSGCGDAGCGGTGCGTAGCNQCGGGRVGFFQRRMAAREARRMQPCEPILSGGLLGKIRGGCGACGGGGCASCAMGGGEELSGLRHACMFCRGSGCSACQFWNPAALVGALAYLKPHTEGGLCRQRWYDFSAGAVFLGHTTHGAGSNVITQRGAGGFGTPVLFGNQGLGGDLEAGIRLSAALIFGPGGNVEVTYMGGQEWEDSATVRAPATLVANPDPTTSGAFPFVIASGADLFSFISDFGTDPIGGFDDTDRSISQTVSSEARFHSGEVNYRRRTVGPYCRFQGSWLMGLRYLRYDENLGLAMVGLNNDGTDATLTDGTLRFFNANNRLKNDMLGVQVGGDLWWNLIPGVSIGVDGKLAWLQNEVRGDLSIRSNSIVGGGPGTATRELQDQNDTLAAEFQFKTIYRLSHSWTYRMSYNLIAIDEVASAGLDAPTINSAISTNSLSTPGLNYNSVVLNGFSVGAEYVW